MAVTQEHWDRVYEALKTADSIAWDTCHKTYVLMDEAQTEQMGTYGYDPLLKVTDPDEALSILKGWYAESCFLRFINGVRTLDNGSTDSNDCFFDLIRQGEDEDED